MRLNIPKYIIVHHTGGVESNPLADTSHHTFEIVEAEHRTNPRVWLGEYSSLGYACGYHYFVDKVGTVTQARLHSDEGAHCKGHNTDSIGICLAGNFDLTLPTPEQVEALKKLLLTLPQLPILPHRAFADKSCYGRNLGDTWAADLIKKVEPTLCLAEKDTIVELKKKLSWYEEIFRWIAEKWS